MADPQEKQGEWIRTGQIDTTKSDIDDIDAFVKFKLWEYKEHNFQDNELWELFKEDFNSFTEQIFKSCNQTWT